MYLGLTIAECIDLTLDESQNLYIKVEANKTYHDALTHEGDDSINIFDDVDNKIEEISIRSSDEEDPFVGEKAAALLRKLARNKKVAADVQVEAAALLEEEVLPLEEAQEVFKSGIMGNLKSTPVSETLFEECQNISGFHLILALGYRVRTEARCWRALQSDALSS